VAPHPLIEYHALLEDGDLAAASAAALSDGQKARRLVFGDRPLCVALRPNLIARWQYDAITTPLPIRASGHPRRRRGSTASSGTTA